MRRKSDIPEFGVTMVRQLTLMERKMGHLRNFKNLGKQFPSWIIQKGWTAVDVGSYEGGWSFAVSEVLEGIGKIYAIEPAPANFLKLVRNIIEAKKKGFALNIVPLLFGLSDKSEVKVLLLCPDAPLMNSYRTLFSEFYIKHYGEQIGSVKTVALSWNDFVYMYNLKHVDICSIDAEGLEQEILQAMTLCMPERLMVARYHSWQFKDCLTTEDLCKLLEEKGYRILMKVGHDIVAEKSGIY